MDDDVIMNPYNLQKLFQAYDSESKNRTILCNTVEEHNPPRDPSSKW